MKSYVLSTCSTVDLSVERLAERKISWKSFHYFMDDKEYFDDMDIRPTDSDIYKSIGGTENVIKYEFNGNDKSFKILKYSAQFLLDTISNTDYEKFNIAIFGKKK